MTAEDKTALQRPEHEATLGKVTNQQALADQEATLDELRRRSAISNQLRLVGIIVGVVFGLLLLLLILMGVYAAFNPGFREGWRDIAIAVSSVFSMITSAIAVGLLITILFILKQTNDVIQLQIVPQIEALTKRVNGITVQVNNIVDSANGVIGNVRDSSDTLTSTTNFAAEKVVTPIIRVGSLMAGVRAFATAVARRDEDAAPTTDPEPVVATSPPPRDPTQTGGV